MARRHQRYQLDELLAKITDENLHPAMEWGAEVGREVWDEGVSDAQRVELDRRVEQYQAGPQVGKSWGAVKENLPPIPEK